MTRKPIGWVHDRRGWHAVYTRASRLRHVMDNHPIYQPCVTCGQPATMADRCIEHSRPVAEEVR